MQNSTFENLFRNRDFILRAFEEHHISFQSFQWFNNQNVLLYYFKGEKKRKDQIEINRKLKNLGFIIQKNSIILNSIFKLNELELAYQFVKKFKSFFIPAWEVIENNTFSGVDRENISEIKYKQIEKKKNNLIVDNFATDLFDDINSNVLKYLFYKGKPDEIEFAISVLKPKNNRKTNKGSEYNIRLQKLKTDLSEIGIKNIPSKKVLASTLSNDNSNFARKGWNYTIKDIWEKYLGVFAEKKQILSDEEQIIDLKKMTSSYCDLSSVTSLNNIKTIKRFYIKDYYLEILNDSGVIQKHKITSYFEKIGVLKSGIDEYEHLFYIINGEGLQSFKNGNFPKDLYYPIKRFINGFFFQNEYFIDDFRVEIDSKIIDWK